MLGAARHEIEGGVDACNADFAAAVGIFSAAGEVAAVSRLGFLSHGQ